MGKNLKGKERSVQPKVLQQAASCDNLISGT